MVCAVSTIHSNRAATLQCHANCNVHAICVVCIIEIVQEVMNALLEYITNHITES